MMIYNLIGLSIALWFITELLLRLYSPTFRWLSGFTGFVVAAVYGIWHLLSAASTWCFFMFLRTKRALSSLRNERA